MYIIVIKKDDKFHHFGTFDSLSAAVAWVRKNELWDEDWYPEELKIVTAFNNQLSVLVF